MHHSFELKKKYFDFASVGPKKEKENGKVQRVYILVNSKGLSFVCKIEN